MPKIINHADIGPSPRKQFLLDWHTGFAEGNLDMMATNMTDDIALEWIGKESVRGRAAFLEVVKARLQPPITELVVREIITHGREAAVNGEIHRESGVVEWFCEVYTFKNTKANTLRSATLYLISNTR